MNMAEHRKGVAHRDAWVTLGLGVSAAAAAISSFSGLRSLAIVTGWPTPLAALLPLTVDAFAMTATRVWLAASTGSGRARRFARWNAICAILLSVAGNGVFHLIAAHLLVVSWGIVLAVGSIPALVLGLVAHLAVLRSQVDGFADGGTRVHARTDGAGTGAACGTAYHDGPYQPAGSPDSGRVPVRQRGRVAGSGSDGGPSPSGPHRPGHQPG